jgi:hypothetical protein
MTTIDPAGDFYERARPFLYPDDTYPGVMASRSGQLVWYYNPLNWGGDPTQPWPMEVINPNAGCHDLHIVDLDGNGLPDVVCSSVFFAGTQAFIAYENAFNNWQIINNPFLDPSGNGIGDSVAFISVNGSARTNAVGATPTGIYWFQNPGTNRNGRWIPSFVGTGGSTNDVGETVIGVVPGGRTDNIIVASGEEPVGPWPPGLVEFSSAEGQSWSTTALDSTYRAVHEIDGGMNFGGLPFFLIAEQEQAGSACNSMGFIEHPADDPFCRVVVYQLQRGAGDAFVPILELSSLGSHNATYVSYNGGIAVVGANHNLYGAPDPALHVWFVTSGTLGKRAPRPRMGADSSGARR